MSTPQPLIFAMYEQASVGCGGAPSLWTHPADERLPANTFAFWSNQARVSLQHVDLDFVNGHDVPRQPETHHVPDEFQA